MRAVVVYESVFMNTHAVADAIAAGIRAAEPTADVLTVHVTDATADDVADVDLVVVGGPTHMHGMSSELSRRKGAENEVNAASERGSASPELEPDSVGPGLRDWIKGLPRVQPGPAAAAFDTRLASRFAGGAANGISRRLRHRGYRLVAASQGFIIEGTAGPIRPDELERAAAWGGEVAESVRTSRALARDGRSED